MLTESQLIGYVESTLPPNERAAVEAALAQDAALRRRVLEQVRLDAALRASLGGAKAQERVKQSVLAVLRGESEAAIKQQVLEDTTHLHRPAAAELGHGRSVRGLPPHPKGEGEAHPVFFLRDALIMFGRWLTGSLSTGERAGVRAKGRSDYWGRVFAGAAACVVLALGVWLVVRSSPTTQGVLLTMEMPARVDFPTNTEMFPRPGTRIQYDRRAGSFTPQPGDGLRVGDSSSGTMSYADGTVLHLEPGTEVRFVTATNSTRTGGKQFTLVGGSLSADVAKQPANFPLLIHTPHATITVVGTEFDLAVGTNATQLEVTHGLVKMSGTNAATAVEVAAGETAVASPDAPPRATRLARNPYLWPFSSSSPWNTPLGRGAQYEPVNAPVFLADGPLTDAAIPRRTFRAGPADPLRGVWVDGERRADVRVAERTILPQGSDTFALMQAGRRFALELFNVRTRADGDLEAQEFERLDLAGPGAGQIAGRARPFGFASLGGLIRTRELESDIPHALAIRVDKSRLNVQPPGGGICVWPATNLTRVPPANGEVTGNLHVGTLLALPPEVDVTKLGLPASMLAVAHALQDYGAYVTAPGPRPLVLLMEERPPGSEIDAALNRLVPLLQVVRNNTAQTPGGGGEPRRALAPKFPNEGK